jgi:hypothetical protein
MATLARAPLAAPVRERFELDALLGFEPRILIDPVFSSRPAQETAPPACQGAEG